MAPASGLTTTNNNNNCSSPLESSQFILTNYHHHCQSHGILGLGMTCILVPHPAPGSGVTTTTTTHRDSPIQSSYFRKPSLLQSQHRFGDDVRPGALAGTSEWDRIRTLVDSSGNRRRVYSALSHLYGYEFTFCGMHDRTFSGRGPQLPKPTWSPGIERRRLVWWAFSPSTVWCCGPLPEH